MPQKFNNNIFPTYTERDKLILKHQAITCWKDWINEEEFFVKEHLYWINLEGGCQEDIFEYRYIMPRILQAQKLTRIDKKNPSLTESVFGDICSQDMIRSSQHIYNKLVDSNKRSFPSEKDYFQVYLDTLKSTEHQEYMAWHISANSPEGKDAKVRKTLFSLLNGEIRFSEMSHEEIQKRSLEIISENPIILN